MYITDFTTSILKEKTELHFTYLFVSKVASNETASP